MAEPKTIAFVSDAIYPYNKGGKETRLYEISTRLAARGHDVHIYCMKWWKGDEISRTENGVHLHAICPKYDLYDGPRRSIKQGILFGIACLKLVFVKFDVIDVDHMPFFPIYGVRLVCWLRGKKMIGTWNEVWGRNYWKDYLGGTKSDIASIIEFIAIKLPDKIISISPLTSNRLISEFGVRPNRVISLACGYNQEEISKAKASALKSDIIFVGRLLSHKNVDVLLDTIVELKKEFPKIMCRIVGTGPEEESLRFKRQELGLEKNIVFHGRLESQTDIYSLMKASKIFVLPSTREGFGIVVLEANACGIPVVTTNDPNNASSELAQDAVELHSKAISEAVANHLRKKAVYGLSEWKRTLHKFQWEKIVSDYENRVLI